MQGGARNGSGRRRAPHLGSLGDVYHFGGALFGSDREPILVKGPVEVYGPEVARVGRHERRRAAALGVENLDDCADRTAAWDQFHLVIQWAADILLVQSALGRGLQFARDREAGETLGEIA